MALGFPALRARVTTRRPRAALLLLCATGGGVRAMASAAAVPPPVVTHVEKLAFPFPTPDPFLFCVYHKARR